MFVCRKTSRNCNWLNYHHIHGPFLKMVLEPISINSLILYNSFYFNTYFYGYHLLLSLIIYQIFAIFLFSQNPILFIKLKFYYTQYNYYFIVIKIIIGNKPQNNFFIFYFVQLCIIVCCQSISQYIFFFK